LGAPADDDDATALVWRPYAHATQCRAALGRVRAVIAKRNGGGDSAPVADWPALVRRDLYEALVQPANLWYGPEDTLTVGPSTLTAGLDRIARCSGGGGTAHDPDGWLHAIRGLVQTWWETQRGGAAGGNGGGDGRDPATTGAMRASVARLADLEPLLPPCMAAVVAHGRRARTLKHWDRLRMGAYLALLGQRDVEEARAFLVGADGCKPLPDIEDCIRPRAGAPPRSYARSCVGLQRHGGGGGGPNTGNVLACPYAAVGECARAHGLALGAYWTPAGFVAARAAAAAAVTASSSKPTFSADPSS
jgi:hypothetical protein